jgi:hypothetical protein
VKINTSHFNLAYDLEMNSVEKKLTRKVVSVLGYPAAVVRDRIMQRIVELTLKFHAVETKRLSGVEDIRFPEIGSTLHCERVELEIGCGRISMTPKQRFANHRDFILHWLYCLFMIVAVRTIERRMDSAVPVYGVGDDALFQDGKDARFTEYCQECPVSPLRDGRTLIIQTGQDSHTSCQDRFVYSKNPLIYILRSSNLGFSGRSMMLVKHLALIINYIQAVIRIPEMAVIGKDIAYVVVARELNNRGQIGAIVLTASNYSSQPLWMRELSSAKTHMVWYSQNAQATIYKSDELETNPPFERWIRVDKHWAWTSAFAQYLENKIHGVSAVAVGPIVWQLPILRKPSNSVICIAVFDVSPYADGLALEDGNLTNHSSSDNVILFMNDIVALRTQLEMHFGFSVEISLKTKRGFKDGYEKSYFEYLENLVCVGGIKLIDPQENIYSLISGSHLVISFPFTSVNYISDLLTVPSIHYDPTGQISRGDSRDSPSLIEFVDSSKMLKNVAIAALSNTFPA